MFLLLPGWPAGISIGHCCSLSACLTAGETSLPLLASQWKPPPGNVQGEGLKCISPDICSLCVNMQISLICLSVCSQGYERVRRSSEEEFYLMRAHDMEEGSSHSDLSTSGEHQTEEVRTAKTTA